jgi:hypothetical protein
MTPLQRLRSRLDERWEDKTMPSPGVAQHGRGNPYPALALILEGQWP